MTILRSNGEENVKLGEWKDQIINRRVFLGAQKASVSAISTAPTWAASEPAIKK